MCNAQAKIYGANTRERALNDKEKKYVSTANNKSYPFNPDYGTRICGKSTRRTPAGSGGGDTRYDIVAGIKPRFWDKTLFLG